MIIFNLLGLGMLLISFGIAFGLGRLFGWTTEGPIMMMAGPLVALLDLGYRRRYAEGSWLHRHKGGSLFFLPLWAFGILWLILGTVYTLRR